VPKKATTRKQTTAKGRTATSKAAPSRKAAARPSSKAAAPKRKAASPAKKAAKKAAAPVKKAAAAVKRTAKKVAATAKKVLPGKSATAKKQTPRTARAGSATRRKGSRLKSISRIDQPEKRTHGWYVRVRFAGQEVSKFFSDKLHGGKKKSLDAALAYRNETEKEFGKPRTDRPVVARQPRRKNDIVGVRYAVKRASTAAGDTSESPVYEVTWSPRPNVVQRTSVSIKKWGKKEAFRRACEIRREKEREFYGFE
jgi:hypothetical protein